MFSNDQTKSVFFKPLIPKLTASFTNLPNVTASAGEDGAVRASLAATEVGVRADAARRQDRPHAADTQGGDEVEGKSCRVR